jgi:hypothetical protein
MTADQKDRRSIRSLGNMLVTEIPRVKNKDECSTVKAERRQRAVPGSRAWETTVIVFVIRGRPD